MEQSIDSFGHKRTVRKHRSIVNLGKRRWKFEEGNLVTTLMRFRMNYTVNKEAQK